MKKMCMRKVYVNYHVFWVLINGVPTTESFTMGVVVHCFVYYYKRMQVITFGKKT